MITISRALLVAPVLLAAACSSTGKLAERAETGGVADDRRVAPAISADATPGSFPDNGVGEAVETDVRGQAVARVLALDFANAIRQMSGPGGRPVSPRFETGGEAAAPFMAWLHRHLVEAGVDAQWVDVASDEERVSHRIDHVWREAAAAIVTVELAVGQAGMRRQYEVRDGDIVRPVSALYVRGMDAGRLVSDDSIFDEAPELQLAAAVSPDEGESGLRDEEAMAAEDEYARDADEVILFRRGSNLIDDGDVRAINAVIDRFDANRDMIALFGCSHGLDAAANRELAESRLDRIRGAFISAGVPDELVMVEICAAGDAQASDEALQGVEVSVLQLNP